MTTNLSNRARDLCNKVVSKFRVFQGPLSLLLLLLSQLEKCEGAGFTSKRCVEIPRHDVLCDLSKTGIGHENIIGPLQPPDGMTTKLAVCLPSTNTWWCVMICV